MTVLHISMANHKIKIIALEITRMCNMQCPHCYTNAGKAIPDELTATEWKELLDQLAEFSPDMLGWSGGEPLLRPDFLDIFGYAYQKHRLRATLVSNGLTITPENLEILKQNGLINIQISLDGSKHEINSLIRGGTEDMFDRIMASLAYCKEAGIEVMLGVMPHPRNIDDLPELVELAKRYNVAYLRFCAFVPFGRGQKDAIRDSYILDHQQYRKFIKFTDRITGIKYMIDRVNGPLPPDYEYGCRTEDGCPAGSKLLYISANGEVYPCTALWDPEFLVGSVRKRPLRELYDDPRMKYVGSFSKENIKGSCRACDNFSNCGGACRGTVYSLTGDLTASLPYCYYREERTNNR
jgi:radical SAM protein with 4Fe4S-binding SPASM domain